MLLYSKKGQVTMVGTGLQEIPLSLIGEVIDKLKEVKYFNNLDLIWGYNSVQIKEGDK